MVVDPAQKNVIRLKCGLHMDSGGRINVHSICKTINNESYTGRLTEKVIGGFINLVSMAFIQSTKGIFS